MRLKKFINRAHIGEILNIFIDDEDGGDVVINEGKAEIRMIDILPYLDYKIDRFSSSKVGSGTCTDVYIKPRRKKKNKRKAQD